MNKQAILFFLIHCLLFTTMSAVTKKIVSDVGAMQIIFIQSVLSLLILSPLIAKYKSWQTSPNLLGLHILRSLVWFGSRLLFFTAIIGIPLANATAIGFAEPLFTTLLAVLLLGEKVGRYRIIGLIVGFIGVLIVATPDASLLVQSSLMVGVAILWSLGAILAKKINHHESIMVQLTYITLFSLLLSAPFALSQWQAISMQHWQFVILITLLFLANMVSYNKAVAKGDLTFLMPITFLQLVFSGVYGYILFNETPTMTVIVGSSTILISVVFVLIREKQNRYDTKLSERVAPLL